MPAVWYFQSPAGEFSIRYRSGYWQARDGTRSLCKRTSPQQALNHLIRNRTTGFAGADLPKSLCDWQFSVDAGSNEEDVSHDAAESYERLMATICGKTNADY